MLEVAAHFLVALLLHATVIVDVVHPASSSGTGECERTSVACRLLGLVGVGKARIERSRAHALFPVLFQALGNAGGKDGFPFTVNRHVFLGLRMKASSECLACAVVLTISKRSS
jgi:hypothetical protein